jgi:hypothetical protein
MNNLVSLYEASVCVSYITEPSGMNSLRTDAIGLAVGVFKNQSVLSEVAQNGDGNNLCGYVHKQKKTIIYTAGSHLLHLLIC